MIETVPSAVLPQLSPRPSGRPVPSNRDAHPERSTAFPSAASAGSLRHLATLSKHSVGAKLPAEATITRYVQPTELQKRAFELLGVEIRLWPGGRAPEVAPIRAAQGWTRIGALELRARR
jgi:hypothetical protein